MTSPRILFCLCILVLAAIAHSQTTPPTAYTITESIAFPPVGSNMTVYRSGSKALMDVSRSAQSDAPASHNLTLFDLASGTSWSWDPAATPSTCNSGRFSGDWGDPFAMTDDLRKHIATGDFKPAGADTVAGIPVKVYSGVNGTTAVKAWFDEKDALVMRAMIGTPNGGALQPLIDIKKVSLAPPAPSLFVLPAFCTSVKPPPMPAELIAAETGDDGDNFIYANYGPGSKNSCSIVLRFVAAKTMAPIDRRFQVAIDTTYNVDNPPQYNLSVGDDGTATFAGGGLHEITDQISNGTLRIDNPPALFYLGMSIVQPNHGVGTALIYRQCFAPVTNLYYIVKNPANPAKGGDWLYARAGKYTGAIH